MKASFDKKITISSIFVVCALIFTFTFSIIQAKENRRGSNNKCTIGCGIKRNDNHTQPDLGAVNKSIIEKYKGICMGNNEKKYIYLTFDSGYEAGYTKKILEVLKQNQVPATFFITAHYVNTQPDLVKQMIDEGHIIGNHI